MWHNKPASVASTDADAEAPEGSGAVQALEEQSTTVGIADGIRIAGDIKGGHDLTIAGEVTGSVFLPGNRVVVHATGDVHANITAHNIEVAGRVVGDLKAADRVLIRRSSSVSGDICAPQIQLEEGCQFKGSVQMRVPDVSRRPPSKPRVIGEPGTVRISAANE